MENGSLVSVIMPAYNSAKFIGEAIKSVQHQTYSHWELFVIDDHSTDNTVAIVESLLRQDNRIHLIKNNINQGAGTARNKGIAAATGNFIAFLDSDDLWLPTKLDVQLRFMKDHNLQLSFSSYGLITETGEPIPYTVEALPELTYSKLLKSNYIGNLTAVYNTHKIGKIYSPLLRKRQDWAMWLTILKEIKTTKGISQPLALYRIRKESLSNNKLALLQYNFRIYREFLNFSFFTSCKYISWFLWEHFLVKPKRVVYSPSADN